MHGRRRPGEMKARNGNAGPEQKDSGQQQNPGLLPSQTNVVQCTQDPKKSDENLAGEHETGSPAGVQSGPRWQDCSGGAQELPSWRLSEADDADVRECYRLI